MRGSVKSATKRRHITSLSRLLLENAKQFHKRIVEVQEKRTTNTRP